jgi:hypothetical protein
MALKVEKFYRDNDRLRKNSYDGSITMNAKTAAVLLSGLIVACAPTQPPNPAPPPAPPSAQVQAPPPPPAPAKAPAQAQAKAPAAESVPVNHIVDIQRASCQDLLKLSPDDREEASMFYIGYQASHFRSRTINVSVIPSIEAQALIYCAENPDQPVAQAFAEAYLRTGR